MNTNDMTARLLSEIGSPCTVEAESTWQPVVIRQDHLRRLVELAYAEGKKGGDERNAA